MAVDSRFLRCVPIVAENHGRVLMQALHKQQQSGNLCDVWLVIENERFAAHKAVLSSFSSYFHALFENGQKADVVGSKACNVKEIVLSSVDKSTFVPILHFIYTSRLHVFKENIADILRTARKLQISSIVEICNKLVDDHVILPTLNDVNQTLDQTVMDANSYSRSNVLYVDLSDCGDPEEMTLSLGAEESISSLASGSNIGTLPDSEANNLALGSQETIDNTSEISNALPATGENRDRLQVRSIYSIATNVRNRKSSGVVTNASSLSTAVSPSCLSLLDTARLTQPMKMTHTETAHLACSHCCKVFSKKANLKRHILIKHSTGHQYSCPKCGKTYAIEQSLQYHMSLSKCSRSSLASLLDDFVPLTTPQPHPALSTVASSINYTDLQSSHPPSPVNEIVDKAIGTSAGPDISPVTSFLHSTLASTSGDDAMSLAIPSTTLFPSIANLDQPSSFDRLDTSTSETYKLPQESYTNFTHSSPIQQEHMTNSDDDMPTISNVQSMREPFMQGPGESFSHTEISVETKECVEDSSNNLQQSNNQQTELPATANIAVTTNSCPVLNSQEDSMSKTTKADSSTTSGNVPNLIRIAPKPSIMTSVKKNFDPQSMITHRDKFPVLVQNPVDVSALAGLFHLPGTEGNRLPFSQSASSQLHHLVSSMQAAHSAGPISTTATYVDLNLIPRCPLCSRVFPSMDALNVHKRRCCKCPFCNRVFSQYSNMKRHVDIFHTKQKPHKCGVCGRAYGIKQSLRLHMQTKHGIPYVTRKYNRNTQQKLN